MQLEWLADFVELARFEVIEKAGTVIAHDRGTPIITPHDNCVLCNLSRMKKVRIESSYDTQARPSPEPQHVHRYPPRKHPARIHR